jgi:protein TonB
MFEDSTFESMGQIHTRSGGWMMATFALNGIILLALVLIPLLDPEALPRWTAPVWMQAPALPVAEIKPQPTPAHAIVLRPQFDGNFQAPSVIHKTLPSADQPETLSRIDIGGSDPNWNGTGSPDNSPNNPLNGQGRITVVQPEQQKLVRLSSTMIEGLLVYKITPTYPAIAKATGTQGSVVLQATISRSGTIGNLRVVSGPALLQQAALDAVRQWRYRPYLLNGQPVEVETTVNVVFKLN